MLFCSFVFMNQIFNRFLCFVFDVLYYFVFCFDALPSNLFNL